MAIDSQGRIVLGGYNTNSLTASARFEAARLTESGALDTTFGNGGKQLIDFGGATQPGFAMTLDSLDRVVMAGLAQINNPTFFAVARLTTAGFLDPSFDGDGRQTIEFTSQSVAYAVAVDSLNRVVVAGRYYNGTNYDIGVARLTEGGALDNSFANSGRLFLAFGSRDDVAYSIAVDALGKIVVGGYMGVTQTKSVFLVVRLTSVGQFDTSFDGDGVKTIDFGGVSDTANSVAIASGNRVLVAGYSQVPQYNFGVARLTGDSTIATPEVNDGAVQRSRLDRITVFFSGPMTFSGPVAQAFTLVRSGGGSVSFTASTTTQNGATVVRLNGFAGQETESGSLRDGRYTLTALSSQISSGGQPLDGDGDGVPGGNFVLGDAQGLYRLFGDINGDRRVDIADFGMFSTSYLNSGNYIAGFDFNGDGRIDILDYIQFSLRYLAPLP